MESMSARIFGVLVLVLGLGCSVDAEDPADTWAAPAGPSQPAQLSCDELVECLQRAEETGQQTCLLAGQDALDDAREAMDICESPDFTGNQDDCYAAQCE